jgi:hypothetical protein
VGPVAFEGPELRAEGVTMSDDGDTSPDEDLGTEAFEQGDEAFDEASRLDPSFTEDVELDPSLEPTLQGDDLELEEAGVVLDDPELMATLDGGIDDPDGVGGVPTGRFSPDEGEEGWDLDAPLTRDGDDEDDDED